MPSWQCKSLQLGHKSFNAIGPCILFTLDNGDTTVSVVVKLRNVIGVSSFDELREVVVDERRVEAWRLPAVGVVRDVGVENFGDSIAGAIGHRRVTDAKVDANDVAANVVNVFPLKQKLYFIQNAIINIINGKFLWVILGIFVYSIVNKLSF